ncbi:heme-binding protein [Phenylobacterium terrae]|uniref:Heme-binding protein n=1 Tax=Phenylobacterium terrae TaxID=2665495 RepID=A0ABW4N642_9CAUL
MALTSQVAQAIIEAADAKARELRQPVIVAVLDAGGHLKAFRRMDGAVLGSIDVATRKARTAVLFACNSEDVWEYCKPGAPAHALELTNGGLAPFGGGVALKSADGGLVGAVGVSGGAVDQDVAVAQAGAAAFAS